MKNNEVTILWNEYKEDKSKPLKVKINTIEKIIESFESLGYQLETMNRSEAKILADMISKDVSYSTASNYCSTLNTFLRAYESKYGLNLEKVYPNKLKPKDEFYYNEDDMIDDVEAFVEKSLSDKSIDIVYRQEYRNTLLSSVCLIILKYYGITFDEMRLIKKDDINSNVIKVGNREKVLSDRAAEYINKYKQLNSIILFCRGMIHIDLPKSDYLFRRESRNNSNLLEPLTKNHMSLMMHRVVNNSNVKSKLFISGAFNSIEEKITNPKDFLLRVREYIGDEVISDVNINKFWISYLEGLD